MKVEIIYPQHEYGVGLYRQADMAVDALYDAKQYDDALNKLQQMKHDFPNRLADIYDYCFFIYKDLKQYEKAFDEIADAVNKGVFLPIGCETMRDGVEKLEGFKALEQKCEAGIAVLKQNAEAILEIHLPKHEYFGKVLLALHGNGHNLTSYKEVMPAEAYLKAGFAIAYLQSPTVWSSDGNIWTDDYAKSREAVGEAVGQIMRTCNISENDIVVTGFSGGAMAALSAVSHGNLDVASIVAFSPGGDGDYIGDKLKSNQKLMVYRGEHEVDIEPLMAKINHYLKIDLTIIKDIGHAIPASHAQIILPLLR